MVGAAVSFSQWFRRVRLRTAARDLRRINSETDRGSAIGRAEGDKAITCKNLAIYGDQEAVPSLAPLLADRSRSWARIALEAIPGPAADEALRRALLR